ncbi:MAG: metallophosphoesterase [Planctomycetales bacterium]|nr:metallophosphoesterase [Planctomycetales bacterium]
MARHLDRRTAMGLIGAAAVSCSWPIRSAAAGWLSQPIKLGIIADLHHDIVHDGVARMQSFVKAMELAKPDAIIQLGDFAYPNAKNRDVIDLFNSSHPKAYHVIGNHDTNGAHTREQCLDVWGMTDNYYMTSIRELTLVVLDGNERGSPMHEGGYPSYVGDEQLNWLQNVLTSVRGPMIIASHQPLAGTFAVDNAEAIQKLLAEYADRILLAINGHSHIDHVRRVKDIVYMHINSASYQWVGGNYQHESYSSEEHSAKPWLSHTCPYRDSLFAVLTIDPDDLSISVDGKESQWVGPSPAELGANISASLTHGEEIAPRIRDRHLQRIRGN